MPCLADAGFSVLVFLLDDMRLDQLPVLKLTNARLADHAVVFDQAYVTVPMCCPERASFLSGGFLPQHTGVLTNEAPRGGFTVFPDSDTLATNLQAAGYATALSGKYLNGYEDTYVPPGWTDWAAVAEGDPWTDFTISAGSSAPDAPGVAAPLVVSGYVTDWQASAASGFIVDHVGEPFFVYVAFRSPHDPHEPAPEDVGTFAGVQYRGGAWQEADMSDKPAWMQDLPVWSAKEVAAQDAVNEERLETLLSVDRAIVSVLDTLEAQGRLDDTVVVITSDNGQQWGEHRLSAKGVGYQESVHMPLVVWNPSLTPRHSSALVAANLDLAATITELAGLEPRGEGQSLVGPLCDDAAAGRDFVPLQGWPYTEPTWAGVVTDKWKYLESATGERELYDLQADPVEAESVAGEAANEATIAALAADLETVRGLAVTSTLLPQATVGAPYDEALTAWGGTPPYAWDVSAGALPDGVRLDSSGRLSGTPTGAANAAFTLEVYDSSSSPYDGRPQHDQRQFLLEVRKGEAEAAPEACGCGGGTGGAMVLGALSGAWATRRRRTAGRG